MVAVLETFSNFIWLTKKCWDCYLCDIELNLRLFMSEFSVKVRHRILNSLVLCRTLASMSDIEWRIGQALS